MDFLQREGTWRRSQLFRAAGRLSEAMGKIVGASAKPTAARTPAPVAATTPPKPRIPDVAPTAAAPPRPVKTPPALAVEPQPEDTPESITFASPAYSVPAEVVLGNTALESPNVGLLGRFRDDGRLLGVSFTKPQCMVLLGYMGSGKSYALGVLIENALLSIPNVSLHQQALCVVAFNYRQNSEARFEYSGFKKPNTRQSEVEALRTLYNAMPIGVKQVNVFGYGPELQRRQGEYEGIPTFPIQFRADELGAEHWEILMKPPSPQTEYMDIVRAIIKTLFYKKQLSYKNLERAIQTDERFAPSQRKHAMNRLSFVHEWLCDERKYEWGDVLTAGSLNVVDLRMQTMTGSDALKLCLVITDLVRRTKNNVNKVIVFDEAHEYVDSKELVKELENAITQIRHDGLSFILASQFPDRIPANIFKYLLTRMVFKLPNQKAIDYVRKAAPNLAGLSPQKVSNLDLEQGVCFVQTDDDCTDTLLRFPQLVAVRPRCTLHGGQTIRSGGSKVSSSRQEEPSNLKEDELTRTDEQGTSENLIAEPSGPKQDEPAGMAAPEARPQQRVPDHIFTNSIGISFVWITPGSFLMGSPAGEKEREGNEGQHRVRLTKGFFMGIYPVTQAQWKKVMGENPSRHQDDVLPVEQVSWHQCIEFCKKMSEMDGKPYRLPSESQWEYACRAGTSTPFYFGETLSSDQANFDASHVYGDGKQGINRRQTTPAGKFPPNAWGLFDLHGNVWEWCSDWYGIYPTEDSVDYQGPTNGAGRVIRGGAWNQIPRRCRSAHRGGSDPRKGRKDVGFRVCFSEE